jgi:uncharacterized protein YqjF (DUF2071 family)
LEQLFVVLCREALLYLFFYSFFRLMRSRQCYETKLKQRWTSRLDFFASDVQHARCELSQPIEAVFLRSFVCAHGSAKDNHQ